GHADAGVAAGEADAERPPGPRPDAELPAEVERMRRPRAGREVAAVATTVHAKLDELVADAEDDGAGQVRRVRGEKLEVARRDARDRVAVLVGAIEVAIVHEVHRAADHADAARRK